MLLCVNYSHVNSCALDASGRANIAWRKQTERGPLQSKTLDAVEALRILVKLPLVEDIYYAYCNVVYCQLSY